MCARKTHVWREREREREIEAGTGADKNSSAREAAACNYALGRVAERASSNSVPDNRENNRVDRSVDGGIEIEREGRETQ